MSLTGVVVTDIEYLVTAVVSGTSCMFTSLKEQEDKNGVGPETRTAAAMIKTLISSVGSADSWASAIEYTSRPLTVNCVHICPLTP